MVWTPGIVAATFFALGFLAGIAVARVLQTAGDKQARLYLTGLVSLIWAMSMVWQMLNPAYHPPIYVHGAMGALAGYYLKTAVEDEDTEEPPTP